MDIIRMRLTGAADGSVTIPIGLSETGSRVEVTVTPAPPELTQAEWEAILDRTAGSIDDPTFARPPQCVCEQQSRHARLNFEPQGRPFRVTVEPWAVEFDVGIADQCSVVADHPARAPTLAVEPFGADLIVTVHEAGSTFIFIRNGVVEFSVPESLAIPELSSKPSKPA